MPCSEFKPVNTNEITSDMVYLSKQNKDVWISAAIENGNPRDVVTRVLHNLPDINYLTPDSFEVSVLKLCKNKTKKNLFYLC